MTKNLYPRCCSKKMKWHDPQLGLWECGKYGYRGSVVVEDSSTQKKLEKLKRWKDFPGKGSSDKFSLISCS